MVMTLGACGDDDSSTDDSATPTTAVAATVAVTASDYAFSGLASEIDAGTKLSLKNSSTKEAHEIVALKLKDGETRPAADLVKLPAAELEALFGGPPAVVIVAPPNADGFVALGNGALSAPGRYLVACFIPTGADPQAYLAAAQASQGEPPEVPGGPPHFTQGMYADLTVK